MRIRVDTREQTPLDFSAYQADVVRGTVSTFDYALDGDQAHFAIERKSLADFVQSVSLVDHYRREVDKIRRAKDLGWLRLYYVVEADYMDVYAYDYNRFKSGKVHPGLIYKRWRELAHDHGVHVVWAGDANGAAWAVYLLLKARAEELSREGDQNAH
jgi:ERCC4-type nuclease